MDSIIEKGAVSFSTLLLIKFAILVAALVVISVGLYLKKRNGKAQLVKVSDYILIGLGALALLSYVNFKPFSSQPHYWDMFHYYTGSKYFPELGYTRLYACVAKAEAESDNPSVRAQAYGRNIRDLKNNVVVPARLYFFDDTFCKARFSARRWEAFKKDVEFFHSRFSRSRNGDFWWDRVQLDHGFNPSPVWALAGGGISNLVPLSDSVLMGITLIDVALLFGCVACLVWAFGLPTAAFAVIACTASGVADWSWIGGSLLRLDWLFLAIFSACAMKRGHYVLAGAALGYAAALRVFPAIFAFGPLVGLLYAIYKRQHDLKLVYGKFFGGMLISAAVLVASATVVYGGESLRAFFDNSGKHSAVVSTNYVGLRTVLTYNPDTAIRKKPLDFNYEDPYRTGGADPRVDYSSWTAAKVEARQKAIPIYVVVVAISLLFFVPAVILGEAWGAIALGATFVPFVWSELSNYYYVFLMVVATLFAANRKVAFPLLLAGIVTAIGRLSGMWEYEISTLSSAAYCIGFLAVWMLVNSQLLFWWQAFFSLIKKRKNV